MELETTEQNTLSKAIAAFNQSDSRCRSKNVFLLNNITKDVESKHCSHYLTLMPSERPVLLLNGSTIRAMGISFPIPNLFFTGVALTTTRFHYSTLKKSILTSLIPLRGEQGAVPLGDLRSVEVGDHDTCLGTGYIGHELIINGKRMGLVRMGMDMTYDDNAIQYINLLFEHLKKCCQIGTGC